MSEKHATGVNVSQVSKDGKRIRIVLGDSDGNPLQPLIVSIPGMEQIIERLSKAVEAAKNTQSINAFEGVQDESVQGFKPTPLVLQAEATATWILRGNPMHAATLVIQTTESIELHLNISQSQLHSLADMARQADDVQFPDNDVVN